MGKEMNNVSKDVSTIALSNDELFSDCKKSIFLIFPDTKTRCWWRAEKTLAPRWTVQRCSIKYLSREATIPHLLC